jgi:prepilin-type processing-associated H-X9-DG protein
MMVIEEEGNQSTPDDGRWVPFDNLISTRHSGKGTSVFADTHVDTVDPKWSTDKRYCDPMF